MNRHARVLTGIVAHAAVVALPLAAHAGATSVGGGAEATLQRDGKNLFLVTRSHSFDLAQFAVKLQTKTVRVEGEGTHRLLVNDDLGAKGDETGRSS